MNWETVAYKSGEAEFQFQIFFAAGTQRISIQSQINFLGFNPNLNSGADQQNCLLLLFEEEEEVSLRPSAPQSSALDGFSHQFYGDNK